MLYSRSVCLNLVISSILLLGAIYPVDASEIFNGSLSSLQSKPKILAQNYRGQLVTVFGRTTCPITLLLIKELKSRKISYQFKDVDVQAEVEGAFQLAFENNMSTEGYRLPLVGLNNKLLVESNGVRIEKVLSELSRTPKSTTTPTNKNSVIPVIIYDKVVDNTYTSRIIKGLQNRGIPYQFKDSKDTSVAAEMWSSLKQSNYTSSTVSLPVVSVQGKTSSFSNFQQILIDLGLK